MELYKRIKRRREELGLTQEELATKMGYKSRSSINKIEMGENDIPQSKIVQFAAALDATPAYLMGWDDSPTRSENPPTITDNFITFPVIGEVAAGYDHVAMEDWEGDTIDVPASYLHGRSPKEYFVLKVIGDSMYPLYMDGDKVLVLRQETLNHSGQIGVLLYNSEQATLKKVEYSMGEDWLRMVPINPNYPPIRIEGADLELCRVLGIPRLLVREIDDK